MTLRIQHSIGDNTEVQAWGWRSQRWQLAEGLENRHIQPFLPPESHLPEIALTFFSPEGM